MIEACNIIIKEYEEKNEDLNFVVNPEAFMLYWSARNYAESNE